MQSLLQKKGVLNKDYKEWIIEKSREIIENAEEYTEQQCGQKIEYLESLNTRKEALANKQQQRLQIGEGLIGTWACVDSCNTFKALYDKASGFPQIRHNKSRCKHLCFYFDDGELGFMSIRLQTWAPFEIQIALNGREWLRRLLDKNDIQS